MKEQFHPPVASITVDCVIFGFHEDQLKILLIKRSSNPEAGKWALPGGFMEEKETLEKAANRVLEMMTGVKGLFLEQIGVFSGLDRHPMGRVVTSGFVSLVNPENYNLEASNHSSEAKWFPVTDRPELPFDHEEIFQKGWTHLKRELKLQPIGFELLPQKFTLTDFQVLYEVVSGEELDRRNFRRKVKAMNMLTELNEKRKGAHVGATLYKFDRKVYERLKTEGFLFHFK